MQNNLINGFLLLFRSFKVVQVSIFYVSKRRFSKAKKTDLKNGNIFSILNPF